MQTAIPHMAVAMAVTSKCESNSTDMASVSFVKVNKNTDELELSYNVNIAFGHQGCNFSSCHAILYRLFYSCKPLLTERMENQ